MSDYLRSQHPVDCLIRELVATRRWPTPSEIGEIVSRVATAPFDPDQDVSVRIKHRGLRYQGEILGARASSLTYHLVKRVVDDQQWAFGTTAEEYLADLRQAVRSADARVILYERRGGCIAAVMTRTRLPPARVGEGAEAWMLVVFSADRGTILSGYQTSSDTPVNIPKDALWLT